MRLALLFIAVLLSNLSLFSQVGVGTTTVNSSAILDISSSSEGLLLPRLSNLERAAISLPAYGLTIFNTDTGTLEFNTGTSLLPSWVAIDTKTTALSSTKQSAKFSNTTTSTDINGAGVINAPLFGTEEWNDNTSLYTVSSDALTVTEAGRYKINVNVSMISNSSGARKAPQMYIAINDTQESAFANTGYIRLGNNHDTGSLHLNEIFNLSADDIISIKIGQSARANSVIFRSAGTSNFYIEKID